MTDRARLPSTHHCFACGLDNQRGLRLRFVRENDSRYGERVSTTTTLEGDLNGFSDRTHGGIVATLLDEAMGWATVAATRRFTYTVELSVRYRLPVPTGQPLQVTGWVSRHRRRLCWTGAEIHDRQSQLLASAEGKFMFATDDENRRIADALIYQPGVDPVTD